MVFPIKQFKLALSLVLFFSLACFLSHCGQIKSGSSFLNEPAPEGTIIAQGSFISLNGKSVTGAAVIYRMADGEDVIRLEGIKVSNAGAGLIVTGKAGGSVVFTSALRSSSGSQNYRTSSSESGTWNAVSIGTASLEWGTALFVN